MSVERMRRLIHEGLDEQQLDVVRDICGDEVELMGQAQSIPVGAILANTEMLYEAMPDLHHVVHQIWQDDDMVVTYYTNEGTFQNELSVERGPMAGLQADPTGDSVEYSGVYLAQFEQDELTAWANHSDRLGAFQQLGILPGWDELTE